MARTVAEAVQIVLLRAAPVRYHRSMDHDDAPRPVPLEWLDAIAESDADLAAGRIIPATAVHAELHASMSRLEAAQITETADQAQPHPRHNPAPSRR
jgi:hypothetical protein